MGGFREGLYGCVVDFRMVLRRFIWLYRQASIRLRSSLANKKEQTSSSQMSLRPE